MLLVFVSCRCRPLLRDLLQVHDAAIGETIQVKAHIRVDSLPCLLFELNIQVHFARSQMVRLPNRTKEHELRRNYYRNARVLLCLQAQEVAHLLVSIFESIIRHFSRINWKDSVRETQLIQKDNAGSVGLGVALMNRSVLLNWTSAWCIYISGLLFGLGIESKLVLDHTLNRENRERNVLVWEHVEAIELEGVARLLVGGQHLEPNQGIDFFDGQRDVVPV